MRFVRERLAAEGGPDVFLPARQEVPLDGVDVPGEQHAARAAIGHVQLQAVQARPIGAVELHLPLAVLLLEDRQGHGADGRVGRCLQDGRRVAEIVRHAKDELLADAPGEALVPGAGQHAHQIVHGRHVGAHGVLAPVVPRRPGRGVERRDRSLAELPGDDSGRSARVAEPRQDAGRLDVAGGRGGKFVGRTEVREADQRRQHDGLAVERPQHVLRVEALGIEAVERLAPGGVQRARADRERQEPAALLPERAAAAVERRADPRACEDRQPPAIADVLLHGRELRTRQLATAVQQRGKLPHVQQDDQVVVVEIRLRQRRGADHVRTVAVPALAVVNRVDEVVRVPVDRIGGVQHAVDDQHFDALADLQRQLGRVVGSQFVGSQPRHDAHRPGRRGRELELHLAHGPGVDRLDRLHRQGHVAVAALRVGRLRWHAGDDVDLDVLRTLGAVVRHRQGDANRDLRDGELVQQLDRSDGQVRLDRTAVVQHGHLHPPRLQVPELLADGRRLLVVGQVDLAEVAEHHQPHLAGNVAEHVARRLHRLREVRSPVGGLEGLEAGHERFLLGDELQSEEGVLAVRFRGQENPDPFGRSERLDPLGQVRCSRREQRGPAGLLAHGVAVVENKHGGAGPGRAGQDIHGPAAHEPREARAQQEDNQAADRHENQLLNAQASAVAPQRVEQELHRRPLAHPKPPAIQQMNDDRQRNRRQSRPKYRWMNKRHLVLVLGREEHR